VKRKSNGYWPDQDVFFEWGGEGPESEEELEDPDGG